MSGLLDWQPYNGHPGYKEATTSKEAADAIASRASLLQSKVLRALAVEPLTADECAERINETVLATRPRLTELRHMGRIKDTGSRRRNASGRSAKVFTLTQG